MEVRTISAPDLIVVKARPQTYSYQESLAAVQRQANRWTYLGMGMTHPKVLETFERIMPGARAKLDNVAPAFC